MVHSFIARPEFQPPGRYVKMTDGRWCMVPDRLPPLLSIEFLKPALRRTHLALEVLQSGGDRASLLSVLGDGELRVGRWPLRTRVPLDDPQGEEDAGSQIMVVDGIRRPVIQSIDAVSPIPEDPKEFVTWLCNTHSAVAAKSKVVPPHGELRRGESMIAAQLDFSGVTLSAAPAIFVADLLRDLGEFVITRTGEDPIISGVLARMQFIMIHPFADGNGRMASLLYEAMLKRAGLVGSRRLPIRQAADLNFPELSWVSRNVVRWGAWAEYLEFWLGLTQLACLLAVEREGP